MPSWNDMIERLHINGEKMSIPEDVRKDVIELDLKRGCVYCGKTWEKWLTHPTRTNLPSWKHIDSYSCKSPQSWNIMLCCHSCNCSQKPGVEKWIAEGYPRTVECNITLKTVAPRVRTYLRIMRRLGKCAA
jgi:hypothetical protein